MLKHEAAAYLAGLTSEDSSNTVNPTNVHVISGEVSGSSEDGKVLISIDGMMFSENDDQYIEVESLGGLEDGDIATILISGEPGHGMTPFALGTTGTVDRVRDVALDAQESAQIAAVAASSAQDSAEEAADAASAAQDSADIAEQHAQQAISDAAVASTAAGDAQTSANVAEQHAQQAITDAATAATAASNAQTSASNAAGAASAAQSSANAAMASAISANDSANSALTQLSIVEDVSGTLSWIRDHGTYRATTDTTVHEGTVYFELVSGDYVPISSPDSSANPRTSGWYVLDISDSQTEYIMTHLAVTNAGLWVLPSGIGQAADAQHAAGYKALLAANGMTIYDNTGAAVVTYGASTTIGAADNVQMLLASDGMEIDNEAGNTIFAVESNSTGTTTVTVVAEVVTWAAETDVTTTANTVSDASAAAGDATVTATVADTDYSLDSTYATATVTAGAGVTVALTSDGVDYVRELMSDAEVTTGTLSVEYQRTVADSASLTFDGSQLVNGSGRAIALLNGVSGTETFFDAHNTVTNARVLFGVGSGGYNRGIWDTLANSWVIYRTQSGKTVIGGPNFAVDASGLVKAGRKVVAAGNKRVALAASAASGSTNRGLWDETGGAWIIYRSTGGSIVLGDSVSDVLYHRESTCSAKTANATVYNNFNHCWSNGACCTIQLCVNLKSSLANASLVDVAEAPSGYRPPYAVFGSVMVTGQNVNLQAEVLADGTIRVNNRSGSAVTTSANIYMSFTFAL